MQTQFAESIIDQTAQRFSRQALAALQPVGQGDADLGMAVGPIQAIEVDQADQIWPSRRMAKTKFSIPSFQSVSKTLSCGALNGRAVVGR